MKPAASPVEIWYNGAREMPLQAKSLFSGISNLRFVDASQFVPSPNQQEEQEGTGYRMKAFAVAHSSFREVMLLDADNTPIRDPAFLFEEPAYTQSGAIFWPDDCGVQSLSRELWTLLDLHPPATEAEFPTAPYAKKSGCKDKRYDNEFEAGQLIIDKGRHWAAVQGVLYMNTNYNYFYQHMHGDKETFRLAFKAAGSPFHLVRYPPTMYGQVLPKKSNDAPPRMCGSGVWGQRHPVSGEVVFVHNYKWFPTQLVDAQFKDPLLQVAADDYTSLIWRKGCGPLAFSVFYTPKHPVVRPLVSLEALVEQRGKQLMRKLWDTPVYQDIFCQKHPPDCQMILKGLLSAA